MGWPITEAISQKSMRLLPKEYGASIASDWPLLLPAILMLSRGLFHRAFCLLSSGYQSPTFCHLVNTLRADQSDEFQFMIMHRALGTGVYFTRGADRRRYWHDFLICFPFYICFPLLTCV